jgi:hypothetical protein
MCEIPRERLGDRVLGEIAPATGNDEKSAPKLSPELSIQLRDLR